MVWESRYTRPDAQLVDEVVSAALGGQVAHRDWQSIETGSASLVALSGEAAVRVGRDTASGARLRRTQQLVDRLPDLPFAVPRSIGPIVQRGGVTAVPTLRIPGGPYPAGSGDPLPLRELLHAIHAIDVSPLRPWLAPARAFCGGPDWYRVLTKQVLPLLPDDVRTESARRVTALANLRSPATCLGHGDLAGANVLWQGGRVSGVLDWDLASEDDPAEDLASLAGWHGWHLASELADAATVARAQVFRQCFPLQVIGFAIVNDRPAAEIDRTVARALPKLRGHAFPAQEP